MDQMTEIEERLLACKTDVDKQIHQIHKLLEDLDAKVTAQEGWFVKSMTGFPDGDPSSHRRYHEILIDKERRKQELIRAIIEKTVTGAIWAFLVWVGIAIWSYFVSNVRGHP